MKKVLGEDRSEFVGGPWDGETSPPDSWDGRWKFSMSKEKTVVFIHTDNGGLLGYYELRHELRGQAERTAWRWEQEETR